MDRPNKNRPKWNAKMMVWRCDGKRNPLISIQFTARCPICYSPMITFSWLMAYRKLVYGGNGSTSVIG